MYEVSTARKTRITTSTRAFSPSIYDDKIVYADSRDARISRGKRHLSI